MNNTSITTIISHTPIWVWFLLALLLFLGIYQLKSRPTKPIRFLILPFMFLPLTIMSFKHSGNVMLSTFAFLLGIIASFVLARWYFQKNPLMAYNEQQQNWVQKGSCLPLIIYLTIFICRYMLSVSVAIGFPFIHHNAFFVFIGLPTGIGLGILLAAYPKSLT